MNCVDIKQIFKSVPLYCVCVCMYCVCVCVCHSKLKDRNFQNIPFIRIIKCPTE